MTHGSLFSGIGGFEQAAQWVGIHTLWSCEIASYPRRILEKVFPKTTKHEDIKQLSNPGYVDVISGGFPCQDISLAGGGVVSTEAALDYGVRCIELYGKLDLDMSSLRTAQLSFFEDSNGSYAIFPKSGMMRNGNVYRMPTLVSTIAGRGCTLLPTPTKVKRQAGRFQEWNQAQGIFVPPSNQHCGFSIAQRVLEMPDREHIGINDGIRGWTPRWMSWKCRESSRS